MKIIYWADFNCPYSYIGNTRLKKAVKDLNLEVEWEMKAFELEPEAGREVKSTTTDRFAIKYSLSKKDAEKEIKEIDKLAKKEGLEFNYAQTQLTSSRDAHRLVKYAQSKKAEIAEDLIEYLFYSYFTENKKLADYSFLLETAEKFQLENFKEILKSDTFHVEVQIDEEDAIFNGIHAVPCYVLNIGDEKLTIPGALTTEEFKIALEDMESGEIENKTFEY